MNYDDNEYVYLVIYMQPPRPQYGDIPNIYIHVLQEKQDGNTIELVKTDSLGSIFKNRFPATATKGITFTVMEAGSSSLLSDDPIVEDLERFNGPSEVISQWIQTPIGPIAGKWVYINPNRIGTSQFTHGHFRAFGLGPILRLNCDYSQKPSYYIVRTSKVAIVFPKEGKPILYGNP